MGWSPKKCVDSEPEIASIRAAEAFRQAKRRAPPATTGAAPAQPRAARRGRRGQGGRRGAGGAYQPTWPRLETPALLLRAGGALRAARIRSHGASRCRRRLANAKKDRQRWPTAHVPTQRARIACAPLRHVPATAATQAQARCQSTRSTTPTARPGRGERPASPSARTRHGQVTCARSRSAVNPSRSLR